jgi:MoaA/NifB/PqqE/SkfB family radical SAM enzyme
MEPQRDSVRQTSFAKKFAYARSFLAGRLVHTNLQLLYDCNFSCRICDFHSAPFRDRPRLSVDDVAVIAQKLATVGPQIISIGGGEPLLHPELARIVAVLAQAHFPVMICNGWFVTPQNAAALFAAGMHEISISVDYADPARHDAQRGQTGAFERAIAALKILHQQRRHPWQRVHMISVVMDDNLDDIERLILLCRELGITYLVTLYSDSRGRLERRTVTQDQSDRLLRLKAQYPQFVQLRGYLARFSEAHHAGGIGPCYAGKHLCNIDSQGNVTLCIDRLHEPLANILHDSMAQVTERLNAAFLGNGCRCCWTSCRGAIETLRYGRGKWGNLWDYYRMTARVPLGTA